MTVACETIRIGCDRITVRHNGNDTTIEAYTAFEVSESEVYHTINARSYRMEWVDSDHVRIASGRVYRISIEPTRVTMESVSPADGSILLFHRIMKIS